MNRQSRCSTSITSVRTRRRTRTSSLRRSAIRSGRSKYCLSSGAVCIPLALHAHCRAVALSSVRNLCGLVSKLPAAQLLHPAPLVGTRKYLFAFRRETPGCRSERQPGVFRYTSINPWGSDEQAASHRKREIFANRTHFCD